MKPLPVVVAIGLTLQLGLKLNAQNTRIGIYSGVVVSNAQVADKIDLYSDYRVFYQMGSFNFNGYVEYDISETFGIAAEPGFIRKGGIVRFGVNHYMSIIEMKLNYGQLPILAYFHCTNKFSISIGPEFAYLMNRQENLPEIASGFDNFNENAFEISGSIGLSYCLSKKIDLGIRYNHGLTEIAVLKWTDGFGPVIGQSNVYNQYFQFFVKYLISS